MLDHFGRKSLSCNGGHFRRLPKKAGRKVSGVEPVTGARGIADAGHFGSRHNSDLAIGPNRNRPCAILDRNFGDARRSPLVARGEAKAISEAELVPSEPMTVVLSEKGWVRAAKGHDIDAAGLSYREGDGLLGAAKARSTQQVAFLDSTGRAYSTVVHSLPSARGNGEPLTGRFSPAAGASFQTLASGADDDRFVLASSHGYGFVTRFENLTGRNKAGKAMLSLTPGAKVLQPAAVGAMDQARVVAVTNVGHLLAFPVADLPELDKGKGNKLIDIPKAKLGTERVVAVAVVPAGGTLTVKSGARTMSLSWKDLDEYVGARATRGGLLPRGWQKVEGLEVA